MKFNFLIKFEVDKTRQNTFIFCNEIYETDKFKSKFKSKQPKPQPKFIFNFLNHFFKFLFKFLVWPFDLLFYAHLGQVRVEQLKVDKTNTAIESRQQPQHVDWLYEILFGTYLLVTIIILRKLLTCMLSDTYCRIQVHNLASLTHKKKFQN